MNMYELLAALNRANVDYVLVGDLIRMKTGTGRSKDALDIEELRKIQEQMREA